MWRPEGKGILVRGHSPCKGPGAGLGLEFWRNSEEIHVMEQSEWGEESRGGGVGVGAGHAWSCRQWEEFGLSPQKGEQWRAVGRGSGSRRMCSLAPSGGIFGEDGWGSVRAGALAEGPGLRTRTQAVARGEVGGAGTHLGAVSTLLPMTPKPPPLAVKHLSLALAWSFL